MRTITIYSNIFQKHLAACWSVITRACDERVSIFPLCKQREEECWRAGERESAFERDAASRHAKPACPAIWQRHGRTSESSKISERGTTATTHMQQVTKKKLAWPQFVEGRQRNTRRQTLRCDDRPDHIAHQYYESDMDGRSVGRRRQADHQKRNVAYYLTQE